MYPLILFIIAIIAAFITLAYSKKEATFKRTVEILLAYIIPLNIGVATTIGFIGHMFYGPEIAAKIGWPAHNPFQVEIAMGNLAMAVTGFVCIWQRRAFWMATVIFAGIFFLGAAYVHIVQMVVHGNYSPYNSGIFLWIGDVAIPAIYLGLTLIYCIQNRFFIKNEE